MKNIIEEIQNEVIRQHEKWGQQNHPSLDQILLGRPGSCTPQRMCEEYEIPTESRAKQKCDIASNRKGITWGHIAVEELSEVISAFNSKARREELIQLAAVCISWIDSIDRNEL